MALPFLDNFLTLPNKICQQFTYETGRADNYWEITFCFTKHAFKHLNS